MHEQYVLACMFDPMQTPRPVQYRRSTQAAPRPAEGPRCGNISHRPEAYTAGSGDALGGTGPRPLEAEGRPRSNNDGGAIVAVKKELSQKYMF